MIVIAYLLGIVVFIVTGIRGGGTPSRRTARITGVVICFGVLCLGALILIRSGGGLATLVALLAVIGSAGYLAATSGTSYPGAGAIRVAGAVFMLIAFAIPSLLTLLFPVVALLAGWAISGQARGPSALTRPDLTRR